MRHHDAHREWLKLQTATPSVSEAVEPLELLGCWQETQTVQVFWKTVGQFLKR